MIYREIILKNHNFLLFAIAARTLSGCGSTQPDIGTADVLSANTPLSCG